MKKWMRKIGALALILALLLALAGCAADEVIGEYEPTIIITDTESSQPEGAPAGQEAPPEDPETADAPENADSENKEPVSDSSADENEEPAGVPDSDVGEEKQPGGDETPEDVGAGIDENGVYNSAEDVALYLHIYGHLPENYITKSEARDLGWNGGSVENYAPGCAIGGDTFGNREGVLPEGRYHECDIDTIGENSRGAKRLVYSDDGRIYYTEDHYESFILLYGEE